MRAYHHSAGPARGEHGGISRLSPAQRAGRIHQVALSPGSPPESPNFAVNCKLTAGSLDDLEPGDVVVLERGTEARFIGILSGDLLPSRVRDFGGGCGGPSL